VNVTLVQGGDGVPRVGLMTETPKLLPISEAQKMFAIPRIAKSMESDAAKTVRVSTVQAAYAAAAEEKTAPNKEFANLVHQGQARKEVIVENLLVIKRFEESQDKQERAAAHILKATCVAVSQALEKQIKDSATSAPTFSAKLSEYLKDYPVSGWVVNRVSRPIPRDSDSLVRVLFPKNPDKGLSFSLEEIKRLKTSPEWDPLLIHSRFLFSILENEDVMATLVDKGVVVKEFLMFSNNIKVPVIPVLPPRALGASKKKPSGVRIPKASSLSLLVKVMIDSATGAIPPSAQEMGKMLEVIFQDPSYSEESEVSIMTQVANRNDQKLVFHKNIGTQLFNRMLDTASAPNILVAKIKEAIKPLQVPWKEGKEAAEVEEKDLMAPFGGSADFPILDSKPSKAELKAFVEANDFAKTFIPKKKNVYIPTRVTRFGPKSKELMAMVTNKQGYYYPIADQVERFLSDFIIADLREVAAESLLASFESSRIPRNRDLGLEAGDDDDDHSNAETDDDANYV
jgi:hypothetical protein